MTAMTAATTGAKLPRIGQHYCRQVDAARQKMLTVHGPLQSRYNAALETLVNTVDRRVRAQINRQLKSMRLEMEAIEAHHVNVVHTALPSVGCYFDEQQRRNAGESSGCSMSSARDLSDFFQVGRTTTKKKPSPQQPQHQMKEDAEAATAAADDEELEYAEDKERRAMLRSKFQSYWDAQPNKPILYAADYVVDVSVCGVCGKGEMVHHDDEGTLQCNAAECGFNMQHITDRSGYGDGGGGGGGGSGCSGGGGGGSGGGSGAGGSGDVGYSAYQRANHFKEIVSQFLATKGNVPDEVYAMIRARMKLERIRPVDLSYSTTRGLLARLQLGKHFDHINRINAHFGIKPPVMPADLRETLYRLFDDLQVPWARMSAGNERNTNVFNYTYVLYQLLKLLGQTHFLPFTSMEADRDGRNNRAKQLEQDARWRIVCQELDWVFHPTV